MLDGFLGVKVSKAPDYNNNMLQMCTFLIKRLNSNVLVYNIKLAI